MTSTETRTASEADAVTVPWFGRLLPWEKTEDGRRTVRYGGRNREVDHFLPSAARAHLFAAGWRLTRRPEFDLDDLRGWPGPGLGRLPRGAMERAEAWLLVPREDCFHGDHHPGLIAALSPLGTTFAAPVTSPGWAPVYSVLADRDNGQFDVRLWIGEGTERGPLAGTITPDFGALVDREVYDPEVEAVVTWTAHSNAGDSLVEAGRWSEACRAFVVDGTATSGGSR